MRRHLRNKLGESSAVAGLVLAAAAWLVIWQLASLVVGQPLILPGPLEVLGALGSICMRPDLWLKVGFSAGRIWGGLLLAYALSCVLALAATAWKPFGTFVRPPLLAVKATPVACVVVLLLIWLGAANVSLVAVFLMAMPGLYFAFESGFGATDRLRLEMLQVHGVRGARRALALTWPESQPYVYAASKALVGMGWKAGVAAELIGTPLGSIGERIYQAKLLLDTPELFAWTIVVIALASITEALLLKVLRISGTASFCLAVRLTRQDARRRGKEGPTSDVGPASDGRIELSGITLAHGAGKGRALSLSVASGERVCLMGPSGLGKTTLLRTIVGLESPASGSLDAPSRLSMEFQETRIFGDRTPVENLLLVADPSRSRHELELLLLEAIPGLDPGLPASDLSGGQARRLELIRALVAPGTAVVLDEPFAGLDEDTHVAMTKLIGRELRGRTLMVATHDSRDAALLGARVYHL